MTITRKFTDDEVGILHRTMMEGASVDDVKLFVATCERTGLDPFASQIMPRKGTTNKKDARGQWVKVITWGALVKIDGLRKIAVDSGEYAGQEGPFWCGPDGVWKDVWLSSTPPNASKVIVHRKGFTHGLPAVALFDSYAQRTNEGKLNQIWTNMGELMLAKCAEALALRKAFPNEMAGLYTQDEMAQADNPPRDKAERPAAPSAAPTPAPMAPTSEPQEAATEPPSAAEPARDKLGWGTDKHEAFQDAMSKVYEVFKRNGKASDHPKILAKWNGRKTKEAATVVVPELQTFLAKLLDAEKRSKGKAPATEPPPEAEPGHEAPTAGDMTNVVEERWEALRGLSPYAEMGDDEFKCHRMRLVEKWADGSDDVLRDVLEGLEHLIEKCKD